MTVPMQRHWRDPIAAIVVVLTVRLPGYWQQAELRRRTTGGRRWVNRSDRGHSTHGGVPIAGISTGTGASVIAGTGATPASGRGLASVGGFCFGFGLPPSLFAVLPFGFPRFVLLFFGLFLLQQLLKRSFSGGCLLQVPHGHGKAASETLQHRVLQLPPDDGGHLHFGCLRSGVGQHGLPVAVFLLQHK